MCAAVTFDVAREFAEALAERMGEELVQVALLGSRARGVARWRSDYDLMVVLRNASGETRSAVHRLATTLELDRNIDLSRVRDKLAVVKHVHTRPTPFRLHAVFHAAEATQTKRSVEATARPASLSS